MQINIQNNQIQIILEAFKDMGASEDQLKKEAEKLQNDEDYLNSWLDCLLADQDNEIYELSQL